MRASSDARADHLGLFAATGITLTALTCNGNPLHPDREVRDKHATCTPAVSSAALNVRTVASLARGWRKKGVKSSRGDSSMCS